MFLGQQFKTAKVFSQTQVRVLRFKFILSSELTREKAKTSLTLGLLPFCCFQILSHEFALSSNFCRLRVPTYIMYLFHESHNCKMVYTEMNDQMNTNFFCCGQVNGEIRPTNFIRYRIIRIKSDIHRYIIYIYKYNIYYRYNVRNIRCFILSLLKVDHSHISFMLAY